MEKNIEIDHFISVVLKEDEMTQEALQGSGMSFYKEEKFDDLLCLYYRCGNISAVKLVAENKEKANNLAENY